MAREGLLVEIDRAVEGLCGIAANQEPGIRDEIAGVAKALEEARSAYPFTGAAVDIDPDRDFRLSPEADEACVALMQFATSDSVATAAHVAFSADLTGANLLYGETRAHQAARKGITVARVPASSSLDEARANLIAGMAWQFEWTKVLVASSEGIDETRYERRVERVQHYLFGGTDASSRTPRQ